MCSVNYLAEEKNAFHGAVNSSRGKIKCWNFHLSSWFFHQEAVLVHEGLAPRAFTVSTVKIRPQQALICNHFPASIVRELLAVVRYRFTMPMRGSKFHEWKSSPELIDRFSSVGLFVQELYINNPGREERTFTCDVSLHKAFASTASGAS